MTWLEHHRASEQFAADAEVAARRGDLAGAQTLYARAADAETRALGEIDPMKARTLGISAVSAVSLNFRVPGEICG